MVWFTDTFLLHVAIVKSSPLDLYVSPILAVANSIRTGGSVTNSISGNLNRQERGTEERRVSIVLESKDRESFVNFISAVCHRNSSRSDDKNVAA